MSLVQLNNAVHSRVTLIRGAVMSQLSYIVHGMATDGTGTASGSTHRSSDGFAVRITVHLYGAIALNVRGCHQRRTRHTSNHPTLTGRSSLTDIELISSFDQASHIGKLPMCHGNSRRLSDERTRCVHKKKRGI